jgi:predicted nucleotidyltransferase
VVREALRLLVEREGAPPMRHNRESPTKDEVLVELAALEEQLRERGLTSLALFGSVVRGAARPDSDIDVLVDVAADARFSLIDLVSVKDFLEDRLGRRVDVVTKEVSNPPSGTVSCARLKPCSDGERLSNLYPSHARGYRQLRRFLRRTRGLAKNRTNASELF